MKIENRNHFKKCLLSIFILTNVVILIFGCASSPSSNKNLNKQLLTAVENGNLKEVRIALTEGADVNAKDSFKRTALMYAAINGYFEIVQCLVENGADTNAEVFSLTALSFAEQKGHTNIQKYLGAAAPGNGEIYAVAIRYAVSLEGKISYLFMAINERALSINDAQKKAEQRFKEQFAHNPNVVFLSSSEIEYHWWYGNRIR